MDVAFAGGMPSKTSARLRMSARVSACLAKSTSVLRSARKAAILPRMIFSFSGLIEPDKRALMLATVVSSFVRCSSALAWSLVFRNDARRGLKAAALVAPIATPFNRSIAMGRH